MVWAVWGVTVRVGESLSLRRASSSRDTQETPFLGTDVSVTASILSAMLTGGKNKTKIKQ